MRRGLIVAMVGGLCGTLALLQTSAAAPDGKAGRRQQIQIKVAGPVGGPVAGSKGKNAGFADSFSFPTDRKARRTLEAAEDFIKDQSWGEAAKLLQSLLDTKEDVFVEVKRGETTHWTSLKGEANRLLGTMPAEGRAFYELQFGAKAKNKLAEARTKSDHHLLAQVAQSYMHTDAGGAALDLLGTYHLDRGSFLNAALCYERLLQHHSAAKLPPVTLLKAHLAFRRNGEAARADEVWKRLTKAARGGVRIGDQTVQLDQLSKELDRYSAPPALASLYDWPLFKGNPSRAAEGTGSAPFLEAKWVYLLANEKQTEQWVGQAVKTQQERLQPVLPSFFPIAATVRTDKETKPLLIYRSFWGIHARNLAKDGKLEWDAPSDYALDALVKNQEKSFLINNNQWVQSYLNSNPQMLYENSTVGTLSTDNRFVYAVEDLVLPPHPLSNQIQQMQWNQPANFGVLDKAVHHSRLQAFDLQTQGKLVWDLGGLNKDKDNKLADCYFLGPPLPVGDKVYVLIDKNSELSLVCLDPPKDDKQVVVSWIQTLVNVRDKMLFDVGRRLQAAQLSYGDGILVCPTNAGVLLGVDLLSHSLAWAHSYREDHPDAQANNGGRVGRPGMGAVAVMPNGVVRTPKFLQDWKTSAPIIQDGRVVFTAPDASSVQCLNLRNGDLLWKQSRADDLYLAGVYNGKVLLVGKSTCRALSLVDGHELWRNDTGLPSGQGVASGNFYYLPLKSGVESKKPEVCAIDIDTGKIPARTQSRKDEVPGNLLFYEGDVISQTATQVVAYRQLRIKRDEINLALKKNPNDPVGLAERGELNLDEGKREEAAADLRNALAHNPPLAVRIKARNKLYETLTEMLRDNFNANERYVDEYKDLCKVSIPEDATPAERQRLQEEQQRREGNFLYLLAKGREGQGRLAEAFDAYLEFGALSSHKDLISVMDQPGVRARPDVWAQGRLAAMVASANPDQRRPLEERIARQWQKVQADKDTNALRHFVAVFGSLFTVGQEARMQLAERLLEDKDYLEAELNFLELRSRGDKQIAARAVEGLARLMTRQGLVEDAAYWYRVLGRDYPQVEIRNRKTGADFYNELATDKRLLAYLDEPRQAWASGRMRAKEVPGSFNQTHAANYVFEPEGEALPFFRHHRIALQNTYHLKVTDRTSGQDRWSLELNRTPILAGLLNSFNASGQSNLRLPYHPLGHLVVLNLGPVVVGFDPVERKKLWEWNLFGTASFPGQSFISQNPDGSFQVNYTNGDSQRLGRTGPIEASYVCLNTREGLVALDPLRGTILWTKSDVSPRTHVFGDDQHIYVVEVRADGTTGPGRALRAHDGVAVDIPDFGPLYQRRLRVVGRNLLLSEKTKSELVLRYYDVQTGKDHWKRSFSPDSIVLQSEDADLLGVAEPSKQARVTVLNLQTQKEVLRTKLDDPKDLEKAQAVYLLSDAERFYVAIHRPSDPNVNPWGGPWPNLVNGIRCVPVNGKVYAFGRETGKREWKGEAQNQMLVLDQFKDLPILLFSARSQELVNVGGFNRGNNMASSTRSYEKRTGKLIYDKRVPTNQTPQFYALVSNVAAGTVELVGLNMKIVHYLDNNAPEKPAADAVSNTSPKGPAESKKPAPSVPGAVPKK
jgi:outer membrane protein assembly factor BamB